jgi:hypothetical protein
MIKLRHVDAHRVLQPLRCQMSMTIAFSSLNISGSLMAKQDRRSTESEQVIPDLDSVEGETDLN